VISRIFCLSLVTGLFGSMAYAGNSPVGLHINGNRLNEHLAALAVFGKNPQGGVSRIAYTEADLKARAYVMDLMRAAKLDVSIDAAGNLVGRRAGSDQRLAPILMGSHIDSVPEGGNFDGDVGSLGAIEVAQILAENHVVTRHPLQVVIFQNEEGGLVGSDAMSAAVSNAMLDSVSRSGKTVRAGIEAIGGQPDQLSTIVRRQGSVAAYLELHIEQGGMLEAGKIDIGVVEGIVGNNRWDITVEGFANHAGSTPMNARKDALLVAAKLIEAVNRIVTSIPGRQVGTIGRIQALPGAYNVIPGKVIMGLDLRDLETAKIKLVYDRISAEAAQLADSSGTTIVFKVLSVNPPAPTDPRIRQIVSESAKSLGLTTQLMPSGATHDAQSMARLGPIGMIFIPSVGGISHSPQEFTPPADIENGANVLLNSLLKLDKAKLD
jgi:N-carbamoyl-L-amino-acid hydrolase